MATEPAPRRPSPLPFIAVYVGLAVAGLAGVVVGVIESGRIDVAPAAWALPVSIAGAIALVLAIALLPLAIAIQSLAASAEAETRRDSDAVSEQLRLLRQIHEHTMLSDRSKRLIYRPKELQLLRSAIEDDIEQADYDAALTLCKEMAEDFGFREEAEQFRTRIETVRREQHEAQVAEAIQSLDESLRQRSWARARVEAGRIRRLFPESPVITTLDKRIDDARQEHTLSLERRFLAAANHGEDENAMTLLRELDHYLSPEEAARLREAAVGVVARHRENLSVQFKLAVNDHRWAEAVRVGHEIVAEFPNTKMANEVRSMLDLLQTRASQAAVAASEA